jgi:hypothetical protein
MKRIKRFGVYQTAKIAAVIYFLIAAVFTLPFWLIVSSMPGNGVFPASLFSSKIFLVIVPFLYGIVAFIMTAIGCVVYNLTAKWTGGIELEVEETPESPELIPAVQ